MARRRSTKGTDKAFDRLIEAAVDPAIGDRYPSGTSFIASDLPSFPALLNDRLNRGLPVAVVFPDGRELIFSGMSGGTATVGAAASFVVTTSFSGCVYIERHESVTKFDDLAPIG